MWPARVMRRTAACIVCFALCVVGLQVLTFFADVRTHVERRSTGHPPIQPPTSQPTPSSWSRVSRRSGAEISGQQQEADTGAAQTGALHSGSGAAVLTGEASTRVAAGALAAGSSAAGIGAGQGQQGSSPLGAAPWQSSSQVHGHAHGARVLDRPMQPAQPHDSSLATAGDSNSATGASSSMQGAGGASMAEDMGSVRPSVAVRMSGVVHAGMQPGNHQPRPIPRLLHQNYMAGAAALEAAAAAAASQSSSGAGHHFRREWIASCGPGVHGAGWVPVLWDAAAADALVFDKYPWVLPLWRALGGGLTLTESTNITGANQQLNSGSSRDNTGNNLAPGSSSNSEHGSSSSSGSASKGPGAAVAMDARTALVARSDVLRALVLHAHGGLYLVRVFSHGMT